MGDGHHGSRVLCGARAGLDENGKIRTESGVGCRQNPPAAGTAIGGDDRGRNTSDECLRRSKKVVTPYKWPVCAKIGGGKGEPIEGSNFSARH